MSKKLLLILTGLILYLHSMATGEPSTYFQVYVPPNNDPVRRDAALIITAIYDSTTFEIIDDGADGDTDDSKTGILMAGQSYVLYIRDNGINDDARYASGGVLKWDGDYFIIKSDKLVFASQSTNSDWQHDWVPSTDKKSIGQKFIIYSPSYTSSKRDINVFAYENNTTITFQKISFKPKTVTGFTDVNLENPVTIFTRTLNVGEDIIYKYTNGRDVMEAGETYMILADKPVTVQYGALYGNERDGGGYVPSSNGSSSGSLLYFGVPFQSGTSGEQEIRIVSWDDSNVVKLDRYNNGVWTPVKTFALNKLKAGDWVGRTNGNTNYATIFRISCTSGKRVSVFEGNWFETGSPGTSDMATMVSAENGTTSGTKFLSYMAPPGNEQNVINPFTKTAFGQQMTHLYIFAKDSAVITVKDAYTNGTKFSKTYTIASGRYADCALTLTEWKNIYNGTGTASGPERPYLLVESNNPVSVMNSNFNDNWMCYVGSSLIQSFTQNSTVSQTSAIPADTVVIKSIINTSQKVDKPCIQVIVQDGLKVIESKLDNTIPGIIDEQPAKTVVKFDSLHSFDANHEYTVETKATACAGSNTGSLLTAKQNTSVETVVTGSVNGQIQQSSTTEVVNVNPGNTSKLIFSRYQDNLITKDSTDSWTASWIDINNDGYDDVFLTDKRSNKSNLIYMNNKKGGFIRGQNIAADSAISMSNTWADIDNDGYNDLLVLNNTRKPNTFYHNINGTLVKDNSLSFTQTVAYYHGGSFADYDNDGKADLFICNYFATRYNELHHNDGGNVFSKELGNVIPSEANQSVGASWADYDGDGFQDLFVPNGTGYKNSLFHNEGNGTFITAQNIITAEGGNSVGSCWGDYDNDGDLDLYVTNANAAGNFFYRNEGNGNFSKITGTATTTDKGASHGCSFADIDNDGDLDLYVTNDLGFKFLYMNNGNGNFTRNTDELIGYNFGNSFGHAWSDFDHDGDLDLFAATHSGQPNGVFINNGNSNHWFAITLTGTVSNKSAIGADVFILCNGKWQMREVNSQSGLGGMSSYTMHFGLGAAAKIDSVKIKWPSGIVQALTAVNADQFLKVTEPVSVKVNGAVFFDANKNGVKDASETLIGHAAIKADPCSNKIYSDNYGYFSIYLGKGSYNFYVLNERGITPSGSQAVNRIITESSGSVDTVWLPAIAVCTNTDASFVMGGTAIRKGFSNNMFTITAGNNGQSPIFNASVKLKAPASLIIGTSNTGYTASDAGTENSIRYKTYTWPVNALAPFENNVITFTSSTDASVNIGDTMRMTGWIETTGADCTPGDNTSIQTYTVVGAIDPNDIQVTPAGYGKEGYIQPGQMLTYTIRFQNNGNHAATSVNITDHLPQGLDMNTLKVVAQSHQGLTASISGQTVSFNYDNIFLPDSLSNADACQGYIVFSIMPVQNISAGTILRNKAGIRFDHYAEVQTNEVVNTIQSRKQEELLIEVKAFPNPAADVVYLSLQHKMGKYTNKQIVLAELYDMTGKLILTKTFTPAGELRFDIPYINNGNYMLKVTDNEGQAYTRKILIIRPN